MRSDLIDPGSLTARQGLILDFIRDYVAREQYPPSIRDILRELGPEFGVRSPSTILLDLKALESAELIKRAAGRSRAIALVGAEAAA